MNYVPHYYPYIFLHYIPQKKSRCFYISLTLVCSSDIKAEENIFNNPVKYKINKLFHPCFADVIYDTYEYDSFDYFDWTCFISVLNAINQI